MSENLSEPIATAATTTLVTASKIGTIGSAAGAGIAGYMGENFFAWAGLLATVFFGAMGTFVAFYYKRKADKREAESHDMMRREHAATMARLTSK